MIVSHRHRFIFLHSLKTAGSSLTIALSRHLGEEDVLSIDNFTLADFIAHDQVPRGFFTPQSIRVLHNEGFTASARVMERVLELGRFSALPAPVDPDRIFADVRESSLYKWRTRQHATAPQMRRAFSSVWDDYFTFAFERNPWDRMISLYHWRWRDLPMRNALPRHPCGSPTRPTFEAFLSSLGRGKEEEKRYRSYRYSNFTSYTIKGKVALSFVGQYERLQADLAHLETRLGLEIRPTFLLPRANTARRATPSTTPPLWTASSRSASTGKSRSSATPSPPI